MQHITPTTLSQFKVHAVFPTREQAIEHATRTHLIPARLNTVRGTLQYLVVSDARNQYAHMP